jgi:hypothetical protein
MDSQVLDLITTLRQCRVIVDYYYSLSKPDLLTAIDRHLLELQRLELRLEGPRLRARLPGAAPSNGRLSAAISADHAPMPPRTSDPRPAGRPGDRPDRR